jgi:hypothetical protein
LWFRKKVVSDSEIEVRLPKSKEGSSYKHTPIATPKDGKTPYKNPDELRFEKAYNKLFSIDV